MEPESGAFWLVRILGTVMKMRILLAALLTAAACGCAGQRVRVSGYLDRQDALSVPPGASVYVVENKEPANRLFDREVALKLEKLLEREGLDPAGRDEAAFLLFYSYGIGGAQTFTESAPLYSSNVATSTGPQGYSYSGWDVGGSVTHVPYTRTVYRKWLVIELVDGAAYRADGEKRPLWVGEASSTDRSTDLRDEINCMLVAAFAYFGEDTGKEVIVYIKANDPRVKDVTDF